MTTASPPGIVCPACASSETRLFFSGDSDRRRDIRRSFTYYLCDHCRLRFQETTPEEARGLYADVQETASILQRSGRKELRCEDEVLRRLSRLAPGRRLLDVGSGDGWLLAAGKKAGFDCTGVDVSERLAEVARRRSGVPVLVGDLADLDLPRESFDVVNVDAVLMYVANPREFLTRIASLLRPEGVCRIREFDPDSLLARMRGQSYWMYAPTHARVWTARSIRAIADAAGLKVVRTIPGTEASLANWLATQRQTSLWRRLKDSCSFWARKVQLFDRRLGAEIVYYLQKPSAKT